MCTIKSQLHVCKYAKFMDPMGLGEIPQNFPKAQHPWDQQKNPRSSLRNQIEEQEQDDENGNQIARHAAGIFN